MKSRHARGEVAQQYSALSAANQIAEGNDEAENPLPREETEDIEYPGPGTESALMLGFLLPSDRACQTPSHQDPHKKWDDV